MSQYLPAMLRERFKKALNEYHPVNDEDINAFLQEFELVNYRKGEVLLKEGEVCKHLYFVLNGGIRCFILDDQGREVNIHFYFEDDLASEFKSLNEQEPSGRHLVTTENTRVLRGYKPDYYPHIAVNIDLVQAAMKFFQQSLFAEEDHAEMLRKLSADDRYQYLLENYPHYLQKVSLTHLASWLGISRESLSRIRSRFSSQHR